MVRFKNSSAYSQGQILLITLLVLTVATTIALSLIGRATIDLSMSNQLEESTRAFDAAEAGIELALKTGIGTNAPMTLSSGVTYTVSVNSIGGATGVVQLAHKTLQNSTETLWLAEHADDGVLNEAPFYTAPSIELCWSRETSSDSIAAVGVGILYKRSSDDTYQIARMAIDPAPVSRSNQFNRTNFTTNGCGLGYYGTTITFASLGINSAVDTVLALRITPYYANATIAVNGGVSQIPKQGNQIESIGETGTGVSRKVVVYQQYRAPQSVFDYVVYSDENFSH